MGFYENGLERTVAVCVGTTAVSFGALPSGVMEAAVGLAGLAGFVLGKSQKFGPECVRVRKRLQKQLLEDYSAYIKADGDDWNLSAELTAANDALQDCLGACFINREALVASAVTPNGFPKQAVLVVLEGLAEQRPELFGSDKHDTLPYRFAYDVVRTGIEEAVNNVDYYKQLEPSLTFEMARTLGEVREDVKDIKSQLELALVKHKRELDIIKADHHATETELVSLLTFILQKRVSVENLIPELERSYERLTELRDGMGDLRSLANEAPEIAPLLEQADAALSAGQAFSIDDAEAALSKATTRYFEIIDERNEQNKRDKNNCAKILGKRAEIAEVKFDYAAAVNFYRQQVSLLIEGLGADHPDTAVSYNNVALNLNAQGRYQDAEPLLQKALEIRERVLGEDHPNTATSYNNMASNLDAQGRYQDAEPLYRKALEICERVLGEEHPNTRSIMQKLKNLSQ